MSIRKVANLEKQMASNRRSGERRRTIPVQISKYHLEGDLKDHFIEGIDVSKKEQPIVKVFLRPDTRNDVVEPRFELADYADKSRTDSYVADSADPDTGAGVLLFQDCLRAGTDGTYSSGWASSAIHNSKSSKERIQIGLCSVDISAPNPEKGKLGRAQVRMLQPHKSKAFSFSQKEQFLSTIQQNMDQPVGVGRYIPEVLIRVIDNSDESGKLATFTTTLRAPTKPVIDDEIPEYCTPEESMIVFLSPSTENPSHKDLQQILALFDDKSLRNVAMNEVSIEVIPIERRNFGPESAKKFYDSAVVVENNSEVTKNFVSKRGDLIRSKFNMKTVEKNEEGKDFIKGHRMFTRAAFVLNRHQDADVDYAFVTKIEPLETWPRGYEESKIPTEHFQNFCNEESEYLVKIRTEENALSPYQLARRIENRTSRQVSQAQSTTTQVDTPETKAPKETAPKTEAPKETAPKTEAPKETAPKTKAPKETAPKTEAPKETAPKTEAPKFNPMDDFSDDELDDDLVAELDDVFASSSMR
jgi:hypothetical protein